MYSYKDGKARSLGSHKKPSRVTTAKLSTWIAKLVRYQGVVVDTKDGFHLVATYKHYSNIGTQAVVVKNSEKKSVIEPESDPGSSIIELKNSSSHYGVYKVLVGEKVLARGTKVLFP